MKRAGILLANVCLILLTQGLAGPVPRALAASQADPAEGPGCTGDPDGENCKGDCQGGEAPAATDPEVVDVGDAPVRGASNAPVTLVVFSDFQCPFSARGEATVAKLLKESPGRVKVAFKNRPLPSHAHARLAGKAALAAGLQGKFWEMHDLLFAHQKHLERADLEAYATQLGLDKAAFVAALDSPELDARLAADAAQADSLQIAGTPTFFVNGKRITGAQPIEAFRAAIASAR